MPARRRRPRKNDQGKPRLDLISPHTVLGLGRALGYGAAKYGAYNFANGDGMEWSRQFAALMRHCWAWWGGEACDNESGLCHLDHALACLDILNRMRHEEIGRDDRPKKRGARRRP